MQTTINPVLQPWMLIAMLAGLVGSGCGRSGDPTSMNPATHQTAATSFERQTSDDAARTAALKRMRELQEQISRQLDRLSIQARQPEQKDGPEMLKKIEVLRELATTLEIELAKAENEQ